MQGFFSAFCSLHIKLKGSEKKHAKANEKKYLENFHTHSFMRIAYKKFIFIPLVLSEKRRKAEAHRDDHDKFSK